MRHAKGKLAEQTVGSSDAGSGPNLGFLAGITAALMGSGCFLAYVSFVRLLA